MIDTMTLVLVLTAAPAVNLYPLIYLFRPWRTTPQGRALMVKAWGNVVLVDMVLAAMVWPDYPGREVVRLVGFALFTAGVNYLLWTLLSVPGARNYPPFRWRNRRRP